MRKRVIITFFAILFAASSAFAQDYKSTATADIGVSLVGRLISLVVNVDSLGGYSTVPVMQLSYDYMVTDFLSAGVAGAYQQYKFSDNTGKIVLKRMNFALRALFHYGKSDKLDMYSGIRLGMTNWGLNYDVTNTDPTLAALEGDNSLTGFHFSPQLVAFGIRGYFTDHIGANVEFAIGAPYYMTGGVNYRF
ncbi:MAG: hypothetical protein GXO80_10825 [Chlorobi bacterium]|nr:hypothetical protein [Chlorobiota bacterium]